MSMPRTGPRCYAPKGTPQAIIDKLNAEVVKILNMPDVKERFAGGGVETIPSTRGRARRPREGGGGSASSRSSKGENQAGLSFVRVPLAAPLPACGERSARETRRVRGALYDFKIWKAPLTPTLSPQAGRGRVACPQ